MGERPVKHTRLSGHCLATVRQRSQVRSITLIRGRRLVCALPNIAGDRKRRSMSPGSRFTASANRASQPGRDRRARGSTHLSLRGEFAGCPLDEMAWCVATLSTDRQRSGPDDEKGGDRRRDGVAAASVRWFGWNAGVHCDRCETHHVDHDHWRAGHRVRSHPRPARGEKHSRCPGDGMAGSRWHGEPADPEHGELPHAGAGPASPEHGPGEDLQLRGEWPPNCRSSARLRPLADGPVQHRRRPLRHLGAQRVVRLPAQWRLRAAHIDHDRRGRQQLGQHPQFIGVGRRRQDLATEYRPGAIMWLPTPPTTGPGAPPSRSMPTCRP